jgi:pyruvate,water dikinase
MTTTERRMAARFTAPGPGSWMLDTTHHGLRPITAFMWPLQKRAFEEGMPRMMERYGLPLAGAIMGDVHGLGYVRILAVGEKPESSGGAPPRLLLKLLARLHPEMRRRNVVAASALADRAWRRDVAWWFDEQRARAVDANLMLQRVDLAALDDDGLARHVDDLVANFLALAVESFANHGGDLIPVGLFLHACAGWGIPASEASAALRGASPATVETERLLAPVAAALQRADPVPSSLDEVVGLGPEVAAAVERWTSLTAWRLLASDDIDSPVLAEQPEVQLRALLRARPVPASTDAPDPRALRARVPAADRPRFDDALAEARHGLTQRDDAVGVAWNWPAGLIRRGLLEVGRRLVERGAAHAAHHAVELEHGEVRPALDGAGPTAEDLAGRRQHRDLIERADPPRNLGPEAPPPPLDAFPAPLATMGGAMLAVINAMEGAAVGGAHAPGSQEAPMLAGVGIGSDPYRGRACVVRSPVDVLGRLQPGDVLVAPFTSPSYNSVFALVGALVTDHGGPMSHTAIMAREYGVAAVVGTGRATACIADGDVVEVDPRTATVRIIDAASA